MILINKCTHKAKIIKKPLLHLMIEIAFFVIGTMLLRAIVIDIQESEYESFAYWDLILGLYMTIISFRDFLTTGRHILVALMKLDK